MKQRACLLAAITFVAAQGLWRQRENAKLENIHTRTGATLIRNFDLRGFELVTSILQQRESDRFREAVAARPGSKVWYWPGLKAMQVSWTWMQALNGLHVETSYQGDYSWLFGRLHFLSTAAGVNGDPRVISLAPFFLVIGADGVGSTLMVDEWVRRYPGQWKTWFFAGYHALENLNAPRLAADYYEHSLSFAGVPDHVAALVLRLRAGSRIEDKKNRDLLIRDLDPNLQERLKRARPEWFSQ